MSYQNRNEHNDDSLAASMQGGMGAVSSSRDSEEVVCCGTGHQEVDLLGSGGEEPAWDAHEAPLFVSELCQQHLRQDVGSFERAPYGGKDDDEYDPCDDDEEEDEDEDDLFSDDPDADFDDDDDEEEDEDEDLDDDFEDVIRLSA